MSGPKERIRAALVEIVGEHGYSKGTIDEALERAAVSREEYERLFADDSECLVECWLAVMREEFWPRSEAAFARGGDDWRESIRYQAWDLLRFLEDDIPRARFLIELSVADEAVQTVRDLAMGRIIDNIHLGRFEREDPDEVPRATAEALTGAIWTGMAQNVMAPANHEALRGGAPQMLYLTMMAYLGQEAAMEEMKRGPEDLERYERGEL